MGGWDGRTDGVYGLVVDGKRFALQLRPVAFDELIKGLESVCHPVRRRCCDADGVGPSLDRI